MVVVRRPRVAQRSEHQRNKLEVEGSNPLPGDSRLNSWTLLRRRTGKHLTVKCGERLGRPECPYLRRWVLALGLFSVRVHHFYRSDDARNHHDHPWWFVTLVLKGGYTDVSEGRLDHLRPGSMRFRPALHRHTVQTDPGGVWTLVLTGPNRRTWGFWVKGRFRKANKYFFEHGHHPCDQP